MRRFFVSSGYREPFSLCGILLRCCNSPYQQNREIHMETRNDLKGKRGLGRLVNACRWSLAGWRAAWQDEEAFRQIVLLAGLGLPLACWLGQGWAEKVLLALPLVICILVELLNSALENVVDRISLERHPLAKKAKDMGSAAQFTAQIFLACVWLSWLLGD